MDLGNLPEFWALLAREFQTLESLPSLAEARLLSARAFDESQPAGHRTYMEVERYLGVARDNHEALLALLEHRGATLWAPWSLLRPIFESAFFASWILDPASGRDRRLRGLRCEVLDCYQQRAHRAAFKKLPEARQLIEEAERQQEQGSLAVYRAEAAALGEPFDRVHQRVNLVVELPKLGFVRGQNDFAVFLEGTWRLLSGFEHGLGWALLRGTDRGAETQVPGGAGLFLSINDEQFVLAAKTTYALLANACRLFKARHLEPSPR
ncbi:hypothetical protein BJY16_007440 [Actinoplanes octamycinicus]|uniref:Uncharacterized protein n=1 Tax=Actinoplanes octamycinicus TaxID=135948 RepID=A0A7W7H4T1_9ACTN|nr:hypothetical protein [Actinoplanes octamycinicus]MBB4743981.1 hypothetical protein [Actinoplanes octamycinicus]GIE58605.1 hypothetical protein Aoc01nite_40070 [Actinoplanes octamycinicus]